LGASAIGPFRNAKDHPERVAWHYRSVVVVEERDRDQSNRKRQKQLVRMKQLAISATHRTVTKFKAVRRGMIDSFRCVAMDGVAA